MSSLRRSRLLIGVAAVAVSVPLLGLGATAASAQTGPNIDVFSQCPVNGFASPGGKRVTICVYGNAAQGSIVIGALNTTFHGPGIVQGGVSGSNLGSTPNWDQALDGQSFIAPKELLPEPAMALLGNPSGVTPPANSDVYVQAVQAGPILFSLTFSSGITVTTTIPVAFHVLNSLVGPNCWIGTTSDPITLNLTTGTSGALTGTLGTLTAYDNGNVLATTGTEVVDGVYSVPAATGCGSGGVFDNDINTTNNLPSASGSNAIELYGNFDLASARYVKHQLGE